MTRIGGGKLEWIPLAELRPHPKAQRPFDQKWADQLASMFDPEKMQLIVVSRTKSGRNFIVDGQHTAHGALQFVGGDGAQSVLCRVFDGDDDAKAAERFLAMNQGRRGVCAIDRFKVSVVQGDPISVGVLAVLEKHGLRVERTRNAGTVQAVDACRSVFNRKSGARLFEAVIRTLREAWGDNPDAYSGQLVRGLGLLFAKWGGEADSDILAHKLAKSGTPADWIGRAKTVAGTMGIGLAQAVCDIVRNEYNKGRRINRLDDKAA